jgi:hypothetical protein
MNSPSKSRKFAEGGIGVYDGNIVHVDVRDGRARWARVAGRYVGIADLVKEPQVIGGERKRGSLRLRGRPNGYTFSPIFRY